MARYRQAPKCPYCQKPYKAVLHKDFMKRETYDGDTFSYWQTDCDCKEVICQRCKRKEVLKNGLCYGCRCLTDK